MAKLGHFCLSEVDLNHIEAGRNQPLASGLAMTFCDEQSFHTGANDAFRIIEILKRNNALKWSLHIFLT